MPVYYFHVLKNGDRRPDADGLDLADSHAAWDEATTALGEMIQFADGRLSPGAEWQIDVADHSGKTVHRLRFTAQSFEEGRK